MRAGARAAWKVEAGALLTLATPLILSNLAQAAIHSTDLVLLGRLGPDALAAGALAINLYNVFMYFGLGLVTAASPLIASERGRKRHSVRDVRRTVRQTMWVAASIVVPFWAILWHSEGIFLLLGQDPQLAADAGRFLRVLQWGLLPYLLQLVLRAYISAMERPLWILLVALITVGFNALICWALIFGHFGLPAMGLEGAGLGSALSALFMCAGMALVVLRHGQFRRYRLFGRFWVSDWARYREVWRLGLPIAITVLLEVSVFSAAIFLMGLISNQALAAHAIALQIAAVSFMVPLGIGQAATVRVGLWRGRRDPVALGRAGWTALGIGTGFMAVMALLMWLMPRLWVAGFIDVADPANAPVVALAVSFLAIAALFQIVDGAQVVAAGVLRGLHDTRVPMIYAGIGYWGLGIGVGALLAFPLGFEGVGIWLGLAIGLAIVAVLMVRRWMLRDRLGLAPSALGPAFLAPPPADADQL